MGLKDNIELAVRNLTRGEQRRANLRGVVGVVVDDRNAADGPLILKAFFCTFILGKPLADRVKGDALTQCGSRGAESVKDIVASPMIRIIRTVART